MKFIIRALFCVTFCLFLSSCLGAPVNKNKREKTHPKQVNRTAAADPEYVRYINELQKDLDDSPGLREQLSKATTEDVKMGVIGDNLSKLSDQVRSQIEEAKRRAVETMRVLQKLKVLKDAPFDTRNAEIAKFEKEFGVKLPDNFDDNDVEKMLQQQKQHLDGLDKQTHDSFKHHEMRLAHQRKEKLKQMDERSRLEAEENRYQKEVEASRQHERLHHPGSKDQMEEIWEEDDGLEKDQFDPKTFFTIHDTNGDGMLDPLELEAMFLTEVNKIYGQDSDQVEVHEEMTRMREHVLKEMDRNMDGLLSLPEFLGYTEGDEWKNDSEGWEGVVDETDHFTDEEYKDWEDDYYEYEDYDENEGHQVEEQHHEPPENVAGHETEQVGQNQYQHDQSPPPVADQVGQVVENEGHAENNQNQDHPKQDQNPHGDQGVPSQEAPTDHPKPDQDDQNPHENQADQNPHGDQGVQSQEAPTKLKSDGEVVTSENEQKENTV